MSCDIRPSHVFVHPGLIDFSMVGQWGSGQNLLSRVPSGADRLYIINDYRKPKEEVRETKYEKLFLEFQQRDAILTLRVHLFIHSFIQILWGLKT